MGGRRKRTPLPIPGQLRAREAARHGTDGEHDAGSGCEHGNQAGSVAVQSPYEGSMDEPRPREGMIQGGGARRHGAPVRPMHISFVAQSGTGKGGLSEGEESPTWKDSVKGYLTVTFQDVSPCVCTYL